MFSQVDSGKRFFIFFFLHFYILIMLKPEKSDKYIFYNNWRLFPPPLLERSALTSYPQQPHYPSVSAVIMSSYENAWSLPSEARSLNGHMEIC